MWSLSILFNWIFNQAPVVTYVTFLNILNLKGAGLLSLAALESRSSAFDVIAIFLPLKLKIISFGFNGKGYEISCCYCFAFGILNDLGRFNYEKEILTVPDIELNTEKTSWLF